MVTGGQFESRKTRIENKYLVSGEGEKILQILDQREPWNTGWILAIDTQHKHSLTELFGRNSRSLRVVWFPISPDVFLDLCSRNHSTIKKNVGNIQFSKPSGGHPVVDLHLRLYPVVFKDSGSKENRIPGYVLEMCSHWREKKSLGGRLLSHHGRRYTLQLNCSKKKRISTWSIIYCQ